MSDVQEADAGAGPAPGTLAYCQSIDVEGDGCVVVPRATVEHWATCECVPKAAGVADVDVGLGGVLFGLGMLLGGAIVWWRCR